MLFLQVFVNIFFFFWKISIFFGKWHTKLQRRFEKQKNLSKSLKDINKAFSVKKFYRYDQNGKKKSLGSFVNTPPKKKKKSPGVCQHPTKKKKISRCLSTPHPEKLKSFHLIWDRKFFQKYGTKTKTCSQEADNNLNRFATTLLT